MNRHNWFGIRLSEDLYVMADTSIGSPRNYKMSKGPRRSMSSSRERLQTRADLHRWVREELCLDLRREKALFEAVDDVIFHYERVWRDSKEDALRVVAHGAAGRFNRMRDELTARDHTSSNIARYFEKLVEDLTQRAHRDPKTQLLNFGRFMEHVGLALSLERRGSWCAIGVADIRAFKTYNDRFGHASGDRIIERVANLLSREVRASDAIAHQPTLGHSTPPLHARFGGDEFCFFLSDLSNDVTASAIADRFRSAVAEHDWSVEDSRLTSGAVNVDIGVVCLRLGPLTERHGNSERIAQELFARADRNLYAVKREQRPYISCEWVQIQAGHLIDVDEHQTPGRARRTHRPPVGPSPAGGEQGKATV
jgi:diguanylate cyclase (GGDEF)-like protein